MVKLHYCTIKGGVYVTKNYMEDLFDFLAPPIISTYEDMCKCQKCLDDIKALTLNNLKPLYIVSPKGESYAKLNELELQFKINIMKAIVTSIEIVTQNVRHDD